MISKRDFYCHLESVEILRGKKFVLWCFQPIFGKMGLCKCPKKKVTNLFCFEHRVNVCEHCLVSNHPKVGIALLSCVSKNCLGWLGLAKTAISGSVCFPHQKRFTKTNPFSNTQNIGCLIEKETCKQQFQVWLVQLQTMTEESLHISPKAESTVFYPSTCHKHWHFRASWAFKCAAQCFVNTVQAVAQSILLEFKSRWPRNPKLHNAHSFTEFHTAGRQSHN